MKYIYTILTLAMLVFGKPMLAQEISPYGEHSQTHEHIPQEGLQLGDKGFAHDEMHPYYQTIFDSGRCYCHTGECRPTEWRSSNESPTGVQMILNGEWVNIPEHAFVKRESVPVELWAYPAHICAFYNNGVLTVECAIIIAGA